MKQIIFITTILLLFTSSLLSAQKFHLKGKVINQQNEPIAFATVYLLKNETIYQEIYTDSLGIFSFEVNKDNYILKIEQFNQLYFSKTIEVNENKDFGNIEIKEITELASVNISKQKKLIEQKNH